MFFSIIFVASAIIIIFMLVDDTRNDPKYNEYEEWRKAFICPVTPITLTFEAILLFFSCMFQKIYREELNAYMVV